MPIRLGRVLVVAVGLAALAGQSDPLAGGWRFSVGGPHETLQASALERPASREAVSLPHRALHPDTAMWYARPIIFPAGGVLSVSADDGAQVFVDSVRWEQDRGVFYPSVPVSAGSHEVVVRVLNNAMAGGLRHVAVISGRPERAPAALPALPPGFESVASENFQRRMPGPTARCDFTLWADSQGGWATFSRLVARINDRPHHFSAGIGDLVNDGSDPAGWAGFIAALTPLAARLPVVPIVGNHDYDGFYNDLVSRQYEALFGREATWMAWSCGAARFTALDMNREFPIGISGDSAQRAWLDREVQSAAWREARWRVLLVHQPPYSRSWAGYDGDEAVRMIARDLVMRHGLQVVVSGHSHAYEHLLRDVEGRPLHILITGGAGGALEAPSSSPVPAPDRVILTHHFVRARAEPGALTFEAVDQEGVILDRWTLR